MTWRFGARLAPVANLPPFAPWPTNRRSSRDMPLHPDFRDLLAVFAAHDVDYLVVGGYAVGFHARPRFTKDIDLWVGHSPENLKRARVALEEFGAPAAMLEQLESALDEDVLWMGVPPVRIDCQRGSWRRFFRMPLSACAGELGRHLRFRHWERRPDRDQASQRPAARSSRRRGAVRTRRGRALTRSAPRHKTGGPLSQTAGLDN